MDLDCVKTRAKAYAAAGSDARMNGCELPVVINSGSGNQGITCCVPVVVYAKELNSTQEQLYRALVLSNLTAIYIKTGIGTLSAFCGAVSAGAAAGAGIAYLYDGTYEEIQHTIVNALAILSGTICDSHVTSNLTIQYFFYILNIHSFGKIPNLFHDQSTMIRLMF